jgi:predicted lipoprotein with Yx(FWY)xxD motif
MRNRWWIASTFAATALTLAACSSGGSNSAGSGASPSSATSSSAPGGASAASASNAVKTAKISGATVLTNAKGLTLYWFVPDTSTMSKCYGSCATYWPPVKGPVTSTGLTGTFGTIKRTDGTLQATYDGHPLYTYAADAPGQAKGNNLNASGGIWHEVTESGTSAAAPASASSSSSSGGGGYGY